MLGTAPIIGAVADALAGLAEPIVLDPVMVAKSGDRLLHADAVAALRVMLPLASVITPKVWLLQECAVLGHATDNEWDGFWRACAAP